MVTLSVKDVEAMKAMDLQIRVAIVDDHSVTAEGLARILSSQPDIEVVGTAGTIANAITLINTEAPHVVLMDYLLPDGNGGVATEQVLARWPDTKVLMLTGSGESDILSLAFDAGCVGFLSKDRPWEEVVDAVRSAAKGEPVIRLDELEGLLHRLKSPAPEVPQWLTARELEVLRRLARAETTAFIAENMYLSTHTVRNHVSNILTKLGAHSRLEAIAVAVRDGIISLEEFG
ncbi:MAG TPA: response regulator transcription factor [Acidimicrobiales bacterium]